MYFAIKHFKYYVEGREFESLPDTHNSGDVTLCLLLTQKYKSDKENVVATGVHASRKLITKRYFYPAKTKKSHTALVPIYHVKNPKSHVIQSPNIYKYNKCKKTWSISCYETIMYTKELCYLVKYVLGNIRDFIF